MAEFATIARPYAKALFNLAQEKNQIESWLVGLEAVSYTHLTLPTNLRV